MTRVLLLVPLLLVPPLLVTGYFVYIEGAQSMPSVSRAANGAGTESNLQAAQTALERANQFLSRAHQGRPGKSAELLTQAVVQYRVCLAYELAAPAAGWLFEDARQNLEVSRLLLEQSARPTPAPKADTAIARATPPSPPASPIPAKPEMVPVHSTPLLPPASKSVPPPEAKPAPTLAPKEKPEPVKVVTPIAPAEEPVKQPEVKKTRTVKTTTIGPDGIEYEKIEVVEPEKVEKR